MATLMPDSPSTSPSFHRRRKSWARRVERLCYRTLSCFPLFFVYGLTTWAVWVQVSISLLGKEVGVWGYVKAGLGMLLYGLADVSYTIAVFTDPGSPLDERCDNAAAGRGGWRGRRKGGAEYEGLPTYEDEEVGTGGRGISTVTAKSSGQQRYCKKCQAVKPDRAHHCSTCGKCVLKMDHHCPWLATCAGLRNYKPFLLFLLYTSLFCWTCFVVSVSWVWLELFDAVAMEDDGLRVINTILLAVLGGIIGLVLSGFTGWHIYLVLSGQTTIESLEKTRYLSPLRKNMEQQFAQQSQRHYRDHSTPSHHHPTHETRTSSPGTSSEEQTLTEHLKEIHANALPGVLRPEEGDTPLRTPSPQRNPPPNQPPWHPSWQSPTYQANQSPAQSHLRSTYASLEAQRERDRYAAYLDEQDSEKLPNAFDLGWKKNFLQVFGEEPWFWVLPVKNSRGDGWEWEVSEKWIRARDEVAEMRARRRGENGERGFQGPGNVGAGGTRGLRWQPGQGFVDPRRPESAGSGVQMQPLDRRKGGDSSEGYDTSSDDDLGKSQGRGSAGGANWNDVPEEFLVPRGRDGGRSTSRGRRKGD